MPSKKEDKYTDPELRQEVKEEIQAGDKGGAPGQWSARKVNNHIIVYQATLTQSIYRRK
jgi:23S rRNA C2498 (ribose-2'-O)-methylase RlmM